VNWSHYRYFATFKTFSAGGGVLGQRRLRTLLPEQVTDLKNLIEG